MRIKKEIYWQHFSTLKEISAQLAKLNEMENLPIMPNCVAIFTDFFITFFVYCMRR
jgi:hypothetical protein